MGCWVKELARASLTATAMLLAITLSAQAQMTGSNPAAKLDFAGSVTWYGQVPIMLAVDKGFFRKLASTSR